MRSFRIIEGDALEVLKAMPDASVDAVVTDPPYDLTSVSRGGSPRVQGSGPFGRVKLETKGFMGKSWDGTGVAFKPETWAEVHRLLKDGSRLLAFGGTRTYHRMACAIEDAGFTIEDCIMWVYGQGFPKHKSKLKPAYEPIVVARKGGASHLNIDACRIDSPDSTLRSNHAELGYGGGNLSTAYQTGSDTGRWPANVILDEESARALDLMSGTLTTNSGTIKERHASLGYHGNGRGSSRTLAGDSGGASRFFLKIKVDQDDSSTYNNDQCGEESTREGNTSAGKMTESSGGDSRTAGFGSRSTAPSLTDLKSTTPTTTRSTTTCQICALSAQQSTTGSTPTSAQTTPLLTGLSTDAVSDAANTGRSPSSRNGRRGRIKATAPTVSACICKNGEPPTATATTPTCESTADETASSRFFYCAKADTSERGAGNTHPTVKPISLMCWLVRLVTPAGGTVLDPFTGSGSTGIAALREGFDFVGIERECEYAEIARRRIIGDAPLFNKENAA